MENQWDDLLLKLGNRLGISDLEWDESGECTLAFDDRLAVSLSVNGLEDPLVLYTILGQLAPEQRLEGYALVLRANLFWTDTGGATMSAEPDTGTIFMAINIPAQNLELAQLEQTLEQFINVAEHWTKRLEDLSGEPGAQTTANTEPALNNMMRV